MDEEIIAVNVLFDSKGRIKTVGYKSFRGLVSVLKRANKNDARSRIYRFIKRPKVIVEEV